MLWSHKSLSISCIVLFILYIIGIGDKYNAGQVYPFVVFLMLMFVCLLLLS